MAKVKIQIKTLWGEVRFEREAENYTFKQALRDANLSGTNLSGTNLSGTDLSGTDLSGTNLRGTNLRGTDLSDADLSGTNLSDADLRGTNLSDADLRDADLRGTNLRGTNLRGTNLRDANLSGTNLSDADLTLLGDYLNQCSRDMLFIFEHLKSELPGLRKALVEGRVNGTQYEGKCACLIGTLGNLNGGVDEVCNAIPYYSKGLNNYGEQWFWQIHQGDTPETNAFAAHAVKLIDMVLEKNNG